MLYKNNSTLDEQILSLIIKIFLIKLQIILQFAQRSSNICQSNEKIQYKK